MSYEFACWFFSSTLGGSTWIGIMSFLLSVLPPPGRQISYTWRLLSKNKKIKESISSKNAYLEEEKRDKLENLKIWVESSYRRLGFTLIYEDFETSQKSWTTKVLLIGISLMATAVAYDNNMVLLLIGSLSTVSCTVIGKAIPKMVMKSNIKALNKYQKMELPILISRFKSIANSSNSNPLNKVLETYIPHAKALRQDIEMTLADIRNFGESRALSNWEIRVTMNNKSSMMEFTMFCEKIKKMYSKGDATYSKTELSTLQRSIDDKYVLPYIKKQSDGKLMRLIFCILFVFSIVGVFLILPMVLSIMESLSAF